MVDIIFEQPNIPYYWLLENFAMVYDRPKKEDLVRYYGDYLKDEFWNQAAFRKILLKSMLKTLLVLKLKPFRIQFADHERTTNC
jgi:hypothetical protein